MNLIKKNQTTHNPQPTTHYLIFAICYLLSADCYSQAKDSTKTKQLDEVLITATRVNSKTPIAFSNISKVEIEQRNLGQDIPSVLNFMPSVVTTSDAGNGFGYSSFRVRGSDITRVNVSLNGIPYNDSESQIVYFVDLPDFASSLQSIQFQRGAGTSTNGSGAFGASLNMQTDNYSEKLKGEISNSYGSFNSYKNTLKFSSGLINNRFEIAGRLSNIHSDGYIDRSKSDLKSYFLQGSFVGKTTLIKTLIFGGKERTYQSWNGVDADKLREDRTYNYAGLYYDNLGNEQFYDNQTDNYLQHHAQLHWNEKWTQNWNTNIAFHYTKGKGYYENYEQTTMPQYFGLVISTPMPGIIIVDLVNQKWLDNDFYGTTFSANYKNKKTDFVFGGSANKYEGKHFDKVIWAKNAQIVNQDGIYFDDFATKTDATLYAKMNYQIAEKVNLYADLQYRNVNYHNNLVDKKYNFLNPKAGISYFIDKNQMLYLSYAKANREPNRTDFKNGNPLPESLDDFEMGFKLNHKKALFNANGFYMLYKNQLVPTGVLDNVGNMIHNNIGKSYRLGIELDGNFQVSEQVNICPNFSFSENKNEDLHYYRDGINYAGNTTIAYSPSYIAGNIIIFKPIKNLEISSLSKFVGEQFLSNNEDKTAMLSNYFTQDFNFQYDLKIKKYFNNISFKFLINNVLDKKYVSNGANYGNGYVTYFPQAGTNFLIGTKIEF